jgi:hypothetical protein
VIYDLLRKQETRKPPPPDPESQDPRRDPEYGNWRGRLPKNREGFASETSTNYKNRNRGYETTHENWNRGYETTHKNQNRGYDTSYGNRGYNTNNDWNESANRLSRALTNLIKMYTEKLQYGGENNNFYQKLKIFYDLCNRAGIPRIARNQAFLTMLRDMALDYYYDNFDNDQRPTPIDDLCTAFQNYFKGSEYRRSMLAQWESITIETIMKRPENIDKSTHHCLKLLINELRQL